MKNTSTNPTPSFRWILWLGWLSISLSFLIFGLSYQWMYLPGTRPIGEIGAIGDWVAGLTAPFLNLTGFFMIYAAFRQQSRDTVDTRAEFQVQRFENTFFNLINLHHQNVNAIQHNFTKKSREDFFEFTHAYLQKALQDNRQLEKVQKAYALHYENNHNLIDHFARHLLFSLHFVHLSRAFEDHPTLDQQEEKNSYLNIMISQLSTDELFLLFYHTLFQPNVQIQQMGPLLIQYRFFDRLVGSGFLLDETHIDRYNEIFKKP
ncbi:MAG: putative phage abortive infection protein [Bacteroidia bacterium]